MTQTKIEEVRKNLAEYVVANPTSQKKIESHPYFFLSLDLVNSTEVKSKDESWPGLLEAFYAGADREIKKIIDVQSWKYVGDEVLFFKRLRNMADLEECVRCAYDAVRTVSGEMRNIQEETPQIKISVKGTAWIANAVRVPPTENRKSIKSEYRNLIISIPAASGQTFRDFLGPDIDVGFRVSKFARSNVLTLSAELARVILKKGSQSVAEKLRIVGYERLKGVWNNRYYPIVWFHHDWRNTDETFEYDDSLDSTHVACAQNCKDSILNSSALDRAFDAVRHTKYTDEFLSLLSAHGANSDDASRELDAVSDAGLEVHCVAVCFNSMGKVLVGKRSDKKRVMPGKWDFGCANLSPNRSFFDAMRDHYKANFGADLNFPSMDPIGQYFLENKGVPGIMFIANVSNPDDVKDRFLKEKHSEVRWIDPNNPDIDAAICVPDFHTTLQKATIAWARGNKTAA